ncbi:MFS transporter [Aureimonas endophytica]|uniref:MFS transporter n=1 Tax=Aureimonas endophytica TaxID=2027858 RepID=A0A916ZNA1_9HYPH|nr:MFS transporter [Aureimonas endophytica]GGE05735.1 MFS transporter [Aureimonas endophytica]
MSIASSTDMARRSVPLPRKPFMLYALTLMTFMAASSVPTPLYRLYQESWGFPPSTLTAIFGAYVLSLLCALLTVGSLSDHVGRKPVLLAALVLEILSVVLFLIAAGPGGLVAARILQGFATGAAMGTLSAGLIDADQARASLFNSLAPLLGLAAGALGCSALVDFAPAPLHLVFLLLLAILTAELVAVILAPETAPRRPGALRSLWPRVHVPAGSRRDLASALPISIAGWALGGLYLSLIPTIVRHVTGSTMALTSGTVVAALASTGAVSILFARPHAPNRIIAVSAAMLALGVTATLAGVLAGSVAIMLAGTVVAGVGFGAGFLGALKTTLSNVSAADRAGLMSALLVVSYVAFSAPVMIAGVAIPIAGLVPTTVAYGTGTILLSLAALAAALRSAFSRRETTQ